MKEKQNQAEAKVQLETKHIPGPWELHISRWPNGQLSGKPYIYAPNGPDTHRHICEPCLEDKGADPGIIEMQEANAVLLAEAPNLLRCLYHLEKELQMAFDDVPAGVDAWMAEARAAMAKATTT